MLHSHRSSVLHVRGAARRGAMDIGSTDTVMPIKPMYHASGWGLPYVAAITGAKLVLPGPSSDAATLIGLINAERVTFASDVPTVWITILQHIEGGGSSIASPVRALIGGSAIGEPLVELLAARGSAPSMPEA